MARINFEVDMGEGLRVLYHFTEAGQSFGCDGLQTPSHRLESTPEKYFRDRLGPNWRARADEKAREYVAERFLKGGAYAEKRA